MSYSQSGEDTYLVEKYFNRVYPNGGVYFEAGAMDGIRYSNTKLLEDDLGWTGILVEPHDINFALLKKNRPNNRLYNCLLGQDGEQNEYVYFENPNLAAVSGVSNTLPSNVLENFYESDDQWIKLQRAENLKSKFIIAKSLSKVISNSGFKKINFFSLDVEGHELQVLRSFDWKSEIDFLLVEVNDNEVHDYIVAKGFSFVEHIANNTLYISEKILTDQPRMFCV